MPASLVSEIDGLVGKRQRSRFLTEAALREVKRLRMLKALARARGAWKDRDHPELRQGAARWIEKLRESEEKRFKEMAK